MSNKPPSLSRESAHQNIENFLALRPLNYRFPEEEANLLRRMVSTLETALEGDKNDPVICGLLSRILLYDIDGIRDYLRALELAKIAQQGGSPQGLHTIGNIYGEGLNVPRDPQRATAYFNQAAQQGFAPSQCALGLMIAEKGKYKEALQYLEPAAQRGYAPAQAMLGYLYLTGKGVRKDFERARELLLPAAQQGYPQAQYLLGFMLWNGSGVEPNVTEAINLWDRASKQGCEEAGQALKVALQSTVPQPPRI